MINLLAVLGRGIQKVTGVGPWVLTEDIEVLKDNGGHAIIRKPLDDSNSDCVIGGGELNLLAGVELYQQYLPRLVVCAYAHRATYLREIDAPTESVVMSKKFAEICEQRGLPEPNLVTWPSKKDVNGVSNTNTEIRNILEFALREGCYSVGIVSVMVQLPRAMVFADAQLKTLDPSRKLKVKFFASELVLTEAWPHVYAPRALKIFSSQAFRRNAGREENGTNDFLRGGGFGYEAWRPFHASFNKA